MDLEFIQGLLYAAILQDTILLLILHLITTKNHVNVIENKERHILGSYVRFQIVASLIHPTPNFQSEITHKLDLCCVLGYLTD